jgi:hypothetical protein
MSEPRLPKTRAWPLTQVRCGYFKCRRLLFPWQSVIVTDPWESGEKMHHSCYHRYHHELWDDFELGWLPPSLDCGCPSPLSAGETAGEQPETSPSTRAEG